MKKILLISLLFTLSVLAQEWTVVNEPFTQASLLDLFFIDENNGWAVGTDGVIIHTYDGGETWEKQISGTDKDITKVFFTDANNGWAGTGNNLLGSTGGTVLFTNNGGESWTEVAYNYINPNVAFVYCDAIYFTDSQTGFLVTGKLKAFYILKTTDGGLTWAKKDSLISTGSNNYRWFDIEFRDGEKGVVVGNNKSIQRYTTNGGENWIPSATINDAFFKDLRVLHWLNDTDIITLGEGNEFNGVPLPVYKSTDAGLTWIKKTQTSAPNKSFERVRDAYFFNSSEGLAVGNNGFSLAFLYRTSDSGETWLPSSAPFGFSLRTITGKNNTVYSLGSSNHIIKSTDMGYTWNVVSIKPTSGFYKISFNNEKGFAINRSGELFRSDDNGDTWEMISSTGNWEGYSSLFLDDNTGFIHKENRYILKTTDGGSTWKDVLPSVSFNARNKTGGISFGDQNTGYAWMSIGAYETHYVYKSTDSGESWSEITRFDTVNYISGDIKFFDPDNGFIVGPGGWARYTTDGGNSWNIPVINVPEGFRKKDFESAAVINGNTAWAVGFWKILKTTDRGATWNSVEHNLPFTDSSFYTIDFFDEQTGYIGCFNGSYLKTTDGGTTWSVDSTFMNQHIFFGSGINEQGELFFGTSNGIILKYKNPFVSVRDKNTLSDYQLYQNYPNPFNPSTTISFSTPVQGPVTIKLFDVLGREVAILVNLNYEAGNHRIVFEAADLTSGVYYYTLKAGGFLSTKKMLLIK